MRVKQTSSTSPVLESHHCIVGYNCAQQRVSGGREGGREGGKDGGIEGGKGEIGRKGRERVGGREGREGRRKGVDNLNIKWCNSHSGTL